MGKGFQARGGPARGRDGKHRIFIPEAALESSIKILRQVVILIRIGEMSRLPTEADDSQRQFPRWVTSGEIGAEMKRDVGAALISEYIENTSILPDTLQLRCDLRKFRCR